MQGSAHGWTSGNPDQVLQVDDHVVQVALFAPANESVTVVERWGLRVGAALLQSPGPSYSLRRTVRLPQAACQRARKRVLDGVACLRASVETGLTPEGAPVMSPAPVRASLSSDARPCSVTLQVSLPKAVLEQQRVCRVEVSYCFPHGATVGLDSHFLWPSLDVSLDWVVEPLTPLTKRMELSVWSPRSASGDSGHAPVSWMPSWPHAAGLFEPHQPLADRDQRHPMPPNTFATSSFPHVTPLAVQYMRMEGTGVGNVVGVYAHAPVFGVESGPPPSWLRLHALVQAVTWRHTRDIVTDLNPGLGSALGVLGPGLWTGEEGAHNATEGMLPMVRSWRSGDPGEHTWCWAMYKSEAGLVNSPLFLMFPLTYVVRALLPAGASALVVLLAGALGCLAALVVAVHVWTAALTPDTPLRDNLPFLLRVASHAFPTAPAYDPANCYVGLPCLDTAPLPVVDANTGKPVPPATYCNEEWSGELADMMAATAGVEMQAMKPLQRSATQVHRPQARPRRPTRSSADNLGLPPPPVLDALEAEADRHTDTPSKQVRASGPGGVVKSCSRSVRWRMDPELRGRLASPLLTLCTCLCGRVTRVFLVATAIWMYFCVQSAVPVCALAIGGGSPWARLSFWAKLAAVIVGGPLITGALTVRFWHVFLFAPPGGVLRRYVLDRVGRILVVSSGFLLLLATWVCAVLLASTGVLHVTSLAFVGAVFFNSLVTLWFLMGHGRLVSGALAVFHEPSLLAFACLVACLCLIAEPFVAAVVASAYPGTLSLTTFWKLQTGLGACLGLFSKVVNIITRIRSRADAYERKVKARLQQEQRRLTRFASI